MALDITDIERYKIYSHRSIEPQFQRLVHMANLRMDKLEKLSKSEGFKGVTKWSMSNIQYEARLHGYLTPSGRISSKIPNNPKELKKRIKELQRFLTSPTSTKSGIIKIYQKRADTINKRYGTTFSWQELGTYFESGTAEKYDSKYGSKTALKSLGEIQKNASEIKKQVAQHKAKTLRVDDSELQNTVDNMLKDKGLTRLGLY